MNTDHAYIEKLLQRFFDGQSTLDEEAELTSFFANDDIPPEWMQYKKVFQYIDTLQPEETKQRIPWYGWLLRCGAAAAVIAIATLIGLKIFNPSQETVTTEAPVAVADSISEPTLAADTTVTIVQSQLVKEATPVFAQSKPRVKARHTKTRPVVANTDSAEIAHTEGELEEAEQEYIADRLLLEQELRNIQPTTTTRSGWITTSLNIQ
ncbi:MAG: hypothetical protein J6S96_03625 [Muribaculaceae bacterium]|nr:hypothetical protein [Muribaculaceae bacterium]